MGDFSWTEIHDVHIDVNWTWLVGWLIGIAALGFVAGRYIWRRRP